MGAPHGVWSLRWVIGRTCLVVVAWLAISPAALGAQDTGFAWPRLEVRGGLTGHGAGACLTKRATGATAGFDLRTRGRWIVSAAVDLFVTNANCFDILYTREYEGQTVERWGHPQLGFTTPRFTLSAGYAFSVLGMSAELTSGLGTVRTRTDYGGPAREDITWRPWYGGALALRLSSALGVQLEAGRHQLAERYYAFERDFYAPEGDVIVAEILRWETMWRLGITVPVIR